MKLSVVIPTCRVKFSKEDYIYSSLKNLCLSVDVLEIIIVYNGKKEIASLKNLFPKNQKIQILASKLKHSRSNSRNIGIKFSSSNFVLVLDDMIKLEASFISNLTTYLQKNKNTDLIIPQIQHSSISKKKITPVVPNFLLQNFKTLNNLPSFDSACFVVNREFFLSTNMFPVELNRYEDCHWGKEIFLKGCSIRYFKNLITYKDVSDHTFSSKIYNMLELKYSRYLSNNILDSLEIEKKTKAPVRLLKANGFNYFFCSKYTLLQYEKEFKIIKTNDLSFIILNEKEAGLLESIQDGAFTDDCDFIALAEKLVSFNILKVFKVKKYEEN